MLFSKSMKPVALPPGRARLSTKPADRISDDREHDRHGAGGLLQRPHGSGTMRQDDIGREHRQFCRLFANVGGLCGPAAVDPHVAADGPT